MDIHIRVHPSGTEVDWKSLSLTDDATLPRYTQRSQFMYELWNNCRTVKLCNCSYDRCQYMCYGESCSRPLDFERLRKDTAHINQPWVSKLIDWLEANENAWLEYD